MAETTARAARAREMNTARESVNVSNTMLDQLREWGYTDPEKLGRLAADLGDIYAAAGDLRMMIETLEKTPASARDVLGQLLSDLYEELSHIREHVESGMPEVDALAEKYED